VASVVFGSLALVNSTRIKEMFSFSSVSNTGWILLAVLFSSSAGLVYMLCYMVISFFSTVLFGYFGLSKVFSSVSFSGWSVSVLWLGFLSLMGLPPLLGFVGKLSVLIPAVWLSVPVMIVLVLSVVVASAGYLTASIGAIFMTLGAGSWLHGFRPTLLAVGLLVILLSMYVWWRDVIREGVFMGSHTPKVAVGLRVGMLLFILSEVCFFAAFFWAFFHNSLSPAAEIGCCWPPVGVVALDTFSVPLLNTVVLLSSGVRVTWAHHSMLCQDKSGVIFGLIVTVLLGGYFTFLQVNEYIMAQFTVTDGIYGSTFFVSTGFHGLHVLIGSLFLLICLLRAAFDGFSAGHHVGLESAAWYWHFVDVVWLFLYTFIYW